MWSSLSHRLDLVTWRAVGTGYRRTGNGANGEAASRTRQLPQSSQHNQHSPLCGDLSKKLSNCRATFSTGHDVNVGQLQQREGYIRHAGSRALFRHVLSGD
jgi:hypothetical protein